MTVKKSKKTKPNNVNNPPTMAQLIQAMRDAQTNLEAKIVLLQNSEDTVSERQSDYNDAIEAFAAAEESGVQEDIESTSAAVEAANGLLTAAEAACGSALSDAVAATAALRNAQTAVWARAVQTP